MPWNATAPLEVRWQPTASHLAERPEPWLRIRSESGTSLSIGEHLENVRAFLADIDPTTGYLRED